MPEENGRKTGGSPQTLPRRVSKRPETAPSVDVRPGTPDPLRSRHARPTRRKQPALLTVTEGAKLLRAPVVTLRYWRHLNTGPRSFRLGRRVRYRRDDLRTWIDARAGQTRGC